MGRFGIDFFGAIEPIAQPLRHAVGPLGEPGDVHPLGVVGLQRAAPKLGIAGVKFVAERLLFKIQPPATEGVTVGEFGQGLDKALIATVDHHYPLVRLRALNGCFPMPSVYSTVYSKVYSMGASNRCLVRILRSRHGCAVRRSDSEPRCVAFLASPCAAPTNRPPTPGGAGGRVGFTMSELLATKSPLLRRKRRRRSYSRSNRSYRKDTCRCTAHIRNRGTRNRCTCSPCSFRYHSSRKGTPRQHNRWLRQPCALLRTLARIALAVVATLAIGGGGFADHGIRRYVAKRKRGSRHKSHYRNECKDRFHHKILHQGNRKQNSNRVIRTAHHDGGRRGAPAFQMIQRQSRAKRGAIRVEMVSGANLLWRTSRAVGRTWPRRARAEVRCRGA